MKRRAGEQLAKIRIGSRALNTTNGQTLGARLIDAVLGRLGERALEVCPGFRAVKEKEAVEYERK